MGAPRGVGESGAVRGVGGVREYWGLAGSVGTQGQRGLGGIRGHWVLLGVGVLGHQGCQVCIGAGRECRYSGARRGIGA